jgi:hypothetical protein
MIVCMLMRVRVTAFGMAVPMMMLRMIGAHELRFLFGSRSNQE